MPQYKNKSQCGPNAVDYYGNYDNWKRSHSIEGTGSVTGCEANSYSGYFESYNIQSGITELCDECLSKPSVSSVSLPDTLITIGNRCFKNSKITSIRLPDGLKEIGHNNFPATLTSLYIPKSIKEFYVDNVTGCHDLKSISVDKENKYYKTKDGILYNFDMTEILFCPNAKTGKITIPSTVRRIGNHCFGWCRSLDMIVIPPSVGEIGDFAFQYVKIDKLIIRNSVKSIGEGCFYAAVISTEFKFSNQVLVIPKQAFCSFECKPELNFLGRVEVIGANTFDCCRAAVLPQSISLFKLKEIQDCAFKSTMSVTNVEFFSSLTKLGDNIFDGCKSDLVVRYFAYAPLTANDNSIGNIGKNVTLVVPKGTKLIFENIAPWSTFPNIDEWETDEDKNDEGQFFKVSDEIYCKRLQSIADSKRKVDRPLLKEIIRELAQTYLYVDSDEEYEEAMSLIAYNRSFSPAIIPELEMRLCKEWTNKYKLRIIENSLLESCSSPLLFADSGIVQTLPFSENVALPMPKPVEILSTKDSGKSSSVSAYFNEEILKQLQNYLTYARKSLKIAVSWFTNGSLFKQLKQIANDGIKIQMIINNDLINNGGYCLNFNELIENENVELSLVEYPHLLHHKFVIIDDDWLITGSYNWTRFSSRNYENIVVITDEVIIRHFSNEFDELVEKAELKRVTKMPDYVKERPEYDRSAFKQYITEELDAQARESSDERDKITALKKAVERNPKYLEEIHSGVQENYREEFEVVDNKVDVQNVILKIAEQEETLSLNSSDTNAVSPQQTSTKPMTSVTVGKVLTRHQETVIENLKASELILCLDVSGSMSDTYAKGHVHKIAKRALATSLALTDEKEIDIWTFGDDAKFEGRYGINQISSIQAVSCRNEGTYLQKFVDKANGSINDDALCIIFTDDDSTSISAAVEGMKQRNNVFWQIIAYKQDVNNIKSAIRSIRNMSVVSLSDYQSKTDEEIYEILLKEYILWKKNRKDC